MKKIKTLFKYIPYLVIAVLVGVTVSYAAGAPISKLTPPGAPVKTMATLANLYELVDTGANTISPASGTALVTPAYGESMYTIGDIYSLLTDKIAAIPADQILTGTTIFGVDGTASAGGGLSATGQTSCWDAVGSSVPCTGTGQDGDTLKGTALSYTDNGNGTVTDNVTGLMWVKDPSAIGTPFDAGMTWQNALTNCNALSYGGHDDWRLPNIKELESLVNFENISPAINTTVFPNTQSGYYWSSTSYQPDGKHSGAWYVDFYNGYMNSDAKTYTNYVRCAR